VVENKFIALMLVLGPVMAGAQTDGPTLRPQGARSVTASAGKEEMTLEQLRIRLALTPEQLSQWSAYEGKVDGYTQLYYREKPILASQESTVSQQIARVVDRLQNRLAALEEVEGAAKAL
jgi:hypothetical protein